jgi:adenylate cyclase
MAEIFISYARPDEPRAERVAEVLRAAGYRVWRDDELPAHRAYVEVIEERLKSADAVVVLWSAEAARSEWVRAEADTARHLGTLVQGTLDGGLPPLPFNQIQCADLNGWDGDTGASGWRKLLASVQSLAPVVK